MHKDESAPLSSMGKCHQLDYLLVLTRIVGIMQGSGQNLQRTSKVQEVELGMQGEQNINGFVSHCRRLGCHLVDCEGLLEGVV